MHINEEMSHTHSHTHTHADGTTHSHPHDHEHEHGHGHEHDHDHAAAPTDPEQVKAILTYMLHHNEHHAEELAGMLEILPEKARAKLSLAIGTFEAANVELKEALECLE